MADLFVYFYELGLRLLKPGGKLSLVVTNKWLKAGYAEPLRKFLAEQSWVESLVDFGHAKQIFEDADVFPCILVTQKPKPDAEPPTPRGAVIPREQLRVDDLSRQIEAEGHDVDRNHFGAEPWQMEPPGANALMTKIRSSGIGLKETIKAKPLFGIKTGLNEAYVVDTATKNALVAADRGSEALFRPFIRGQDTARWYPEWAGLWMIAMKSSDNFAWPWADKGEDAESTFGRTYPALHRRLRGFEDKLRKRQDQGRYWWELRSCSYWDVLERPKIIYPDIAWRAQFAVDMRGAVVANTIYILPTTDKWVMAVLNSPIAWWFSWREAQHGKDDALRFMTPFVEGFPIPKATDRQRDQAEECVERLEKSATVRQSAVSSTLDWLKVEFEVAKPTLKLQSPADLDADAFVTEVKKARGRGKTLTAAALKSLRDEHARTLGPVRDQAAEALTLERRLNDLVNAAYGLTPADVTLMWQTAPPRMPLAPGNGAPIPNIGSDTRLAATS